MQIQLFMSNFSHDRAEDVTADRPGGWLHGGMKKPTDMTSLAEAVGATSSKNHIPDLLLRKEEWGGLVFNKKDHSIYEVDKDAFEVFLRLSSGEDFTNIANSSNIPRNSLDDFIASAKKYDLYN